MGPEPPAERPLVGVVESGRETGGAGGRAVVRTRAGGPTPASTWVAASGGPITDQLLEWPPDVFALTNVVLERAEAFRYALAPGWSLSREDGADGVEEAGRRWSAWAEDRSGAIPDLIAAEWSLFANAPRCRSSSSRLVQMRGCVRHC